MRAARKLAGMPDEDAPSADFSKERDDYDCPLCHELLYEPCVPPCGHPFCRDCLRNVLKHSASQSPGAGAKCPVCRQVLHVTRADNLAVCSQFDRLLALAFPTEHAQRKEAAAGPAESCETPVAADGQTTQRLPIFLLDSTLPGQHLKLNVFELRYVGMVRRALEGSRCFGMAGFERDGSQATYGVEVNILSVSEQTDGRFHIEVVGQRPFKILQTSLEDYGLVVADIEYFDFESGGTEDQTAEAAAAELLPLVTEWEEAVCRGGWERRPGHLALVREHLGVMPTTQQPGALANWVAALINPLPGLGVAPEIRPALLAASSPLERVRVARGGLQASIHYLKAAERGLVAWALKRLPQPVRQFLPVLGVLGLAFFISRYS
mmetsp:Transcript_6075/g.10524  ORF Transcript_6075/g.10524 Transcript_6075/m.10524 type:complete len:379 (-) Transcript_6075:146-1282(-)